MNYSKDIPTLTVIDSQFLLQSVSMEPFGILAAGFRQYENAIENTIDHYSNDTKKSRMKQAKIMGNSDFKDCKGFLDID